jgi:hypothetical protein
MAIIVAEYKPEVFKIPVLFYSNNEGYEYLSYISIRSYNYQNKLVEFDFTKNESFDVNLCSPFGALLEGLTQRDNNITFKNLSNYLEIEFRKNGFYKLMDNSYEIDGLRAATMDFKRFSLTDASVFQEYIGKQLFEQKDFPHVSPLLRRKIIKSILEIFNNAILHGGCEHVYTCGHYSLADMKFKFTMSDMGTTIRKNVNKYFNRGSGISGELAISWAVQQGNTTKSGSIPGGLGFSLIRTFLKLNEGNIQIISSNGYWEERNGIIFGAALKSRFLGTIINFEFNLNDQNSYVLSEEIDAKNVL